MAAVDRVDIEIERPAGYVLIKQLALRARIVGATVVVVISIGRAGIVVGVRDAAAKPCGHRRLGIYERGCRPPCDRGLIHYALPKPIHVGRVTGCGGSIALGRFVGPSLDLSLRPLNIIGWESPG
jgi:hypothetical protein